ncbi:CorA Mg2+ transport-like protein [Botrytis cinerea]
MTSMSTEELLKRLDDQHQAYLETFKLVHDALNNSLTNTNTNSASVAPAPAPAPQSPGSIRTFTKRRRVSARDDGDIPEVRPSTLHSSVLSGDSDDNAGHIILETVITKNGRLLDPVLFPDYHRADRSHNSHYSVFDVGKDGAPLSRRDVVKPGTTKIDSAIWQAVKDLNSDPESLRPVVGRITIVREPSPVVLGALHLTLNKTFDMDELFNYLISDEVTSANIMRRPFSADSRQQKSFVFNFDTSKDHIPISRCNSVVALSLSGDPIRKLRNPARRARTDYGYVYDPWAAWHVLNVQCYPDHRHTMDVHDSTKHYVNGPEAFLHTLLSEFKDAEKRFEAIYMKISKLVSPPANFMFDGEIRDKLLFEDEEFTYSRRYFWAYQTLGLMKNGIKAIMDSYEDTFTDDVWEGKHKTLWPILDPDSHRSKYWQKRMQKLKLDFEKQMNNLFKLYEETDEKMKEIRTLRDQLFSGTSVLESRKSVEMAAVTILQGHNIKLLTMVSIFFLPLTFVTSVYGMTNMTTDHDFTPFAITMATVCVPFFFLVGALNTTSDPAQSYPSTSASSININDKPKPLPHSYSITTAQSLAARKELTSNTQHQSPIKSPFSPSTSPSSMNPIPEHPLTIPMTSYTPVTRPKI